MPTTEQLAEWDAWLAERPAAVAEVARRLPPWQKYRLASTGQAAAILSYGENATGAVTITAQCWRDDMDERMPAESRAAWAKLTSRGVFGLDPNDFIVDEKP